MKTRKQEITFVVAALWLVACSSSTTTPGAGSAGTSQAGASQGGAPQGGSGQGGSAQGAQGGNAAAGGGQGGDPGQGGASTAGSSAGGQAGTSGGTGYDPAICAPACANMVDCEDGSIDTAACEAQCELELKGEGNLIPEMANDYFSFIQSSPHELGCSFLFSDNLWGNTWGTGTAAVEKYKSLKEQDLLETCVKVKVKCDGETPEITHRSDCVRYYYKYNTPKRKEVESCFSSKCLDLAYCIGTHIVKGRPWLAGLPATSQ